MVQPISDFGSRSCRRLRRGEEQVPCDESVVHRVVEGRMPSWWQGASGRVV